MSTELPTTLYRIQNLFIKTPEDYAIKVDGLDFAISAISNETHFYHKLNLPIFIEFPDALPIAIVQYNYYQHFNLDDIIKMNSEYPGTVRMSEEPINPIHLGQSVEMMEDFLRSIAVRIRAEYRMAGYRAEKTIRDQELAH